MNAPTPSTARAAWPSALCVAAIVHGLSISVLWWSRTLGEMSGPYLAAGLLWTCAWIFVWPLLAMVRRVRWPCVALSLLALAPALPIAFIATLVMLGAKT
jgi:hypothetical protein